MKKFSILIAGFILSFQLYAQVKPQKAPLNPSYIKYLEAKKSGSLKSTGQDEFTMGYLPSPMYLHFKERPATGKQKGTSELPSSYDLRTLGFVSSVKNQGGGQFGGNCVAFATMGTLESRLMVTGHGEYDLSEQNIAACYGYEWAYGEGANQAMATAYLSRFSGPVLEVEDPYNTNPPNECITGIAPLYYVPETRWYPKDYDLIKRAIMKYGALYTSVHIEYANFNYTFNTYYYNGTESNNHAWVVVGWDDYLLVPGASKVGAWIIKNSWGDTWAESGFVYCSYDDAGIMEDLAFYPEIWDKDKVDKLYMYDELCAVSSIGYGAPIGYGLAKFSTPGAELLTKVGTFVNAEGSVLDIEIYDDFDGDDLSNLITSKKNIFVDFPGYYTFDIPTSVNGDFFVKVKYKTPGFNYPIPVETASEGYANPVIDTSVNWISPNGSNWWSDNPDPEEDSDGENLTIRAYTKTGSAPQAIFEANKSTACLNSDVIFTYLENNPASEFHWDFGSGASPATADTRGPHMVTYATEGSKTISLIVNGAGGSDTTIRHDYLSVSTEINVAIPDSAIRLPLGKSFEITAFGADAYTWSPGTNLDKTTGQTVTVTPTEQGDFTYTVTGQQGTCFGTDKIIINARVNPPNDDVCNAIELSPGGWFGVYNNINATVENNEPAPPEGDCNTPLFWCKEGGLQNSVWFTFVGTQKGIVSFDSEGFDEQIAIYEADTCTDILNDNWTLIAANDDYYPANKFYACALDTIPVKPGQKYFVQFDGSAGGTEGYFSFIFWDAPLGYENIKTSPGVVIYPNPASGLFNLSMDVEECKPVSVQVFNLSGQLIYSRDYPFTSSRLETTLDLSDKAPGIYQFRIINGNNLVNRQIIIE